MEIPEYFEKGIDLDLNPIRLLYNERRYKYYHTITYVDKYQAYLTPDHFKASGRLPFNYNQRLKMFVVGKAFKSAKNHGDNTMFTFSTIEDHHTVIDWICSKYWVPLSLLDAKPFEQVDEYLTITRRWIDDTAD